MSWWDEGWIAFYLGIPQYVIRLPLALLLVIALVTGFKEVEPEMRKTRWVMVLFLILVLITGLVVSLDKLVWRSYEHGDLLLPVWGISSVTLSVNSLFLVIFVVILWTGISKRKENALRLDWTLDSSCYINT